MRWLATSCLSMVLALALALSANAQSPNPSQPNQGAQAETSAQQHDAVTSEATTAVEQPTAVPTAASGTTNIYNQYKQSSPNGDFPTWLQAIASIGLAIFAFWQINFVKRTTTASENAAEAARDAVIATQQYVELTKDLAATTKQSVELARLSLSTERPYITVTPVSVTATSIGAEIRFTLRNDGNRPAIIKDIFADIGWEQKPNCPSIENRREHAGANSRRIHEYVLAPGRLSREYLLFYNDEPPDLRMTDNAQMFQAIHDQRQQSNRELHMFGFILYSDPAETRYYLEFCWSLVVFAGLRDQFYLDIFVDRVIPPAPNSEQT